MTALADAIVLEVGWWQWNRMNAERAARAGFTKVMYPVDFVDDIAARASAAGTRRASS